jgi:hypothetical protein
MEKPGCMPVPSPGFRRKKIIKPQDVHLNLGIPNPLALGSYYALIPSFFINLLLIAHTYLEDK